MTSKPGEKSFLDKVVEARERAAEMRVVEQTLGISGPGAGGGESLAASVVTGAMGQQKILFDAFQAQIAQANLQLSEAKAERERAQTELYNEKVVILRAEREKLDDAAEAAKGAGAPKSQMDIYREIRKEIDGEIGELKKDAPKVEGVQAMSADTIITLKKLELDQAMTLAKITADAQSQQNEFMLKMKEFDENAQRRWAEYKDSRDFRREGMDGVQDLVHAIGDGIAQDRKGAGGGDGSKITGKGEKKSAPDQEEKVGAFITSFPCSQCEEKVEVDEKAGKGVCPGCGAEYAIRSTE